MEESEALIVVYVEEYHKPLARPSASLAIKGLEKPLKFTAKSPAGTAVVAGNDVLHAIGWSASAGWNVDGPENFTFSAPAGKVSLLPYKIMLINKSQIDIRPLSAMDIQFAQGQFAKNKALADLDIIIPDLIPEE